MEISDIVERLLKPFMDNRQDAQGSLPDMQSDLKAKLEGDGVEIQERRMNPISTTTDIFNSFISNLKSGNYKLAAIDFLMLGLQAMPAYVKSDFSPTGEGTELDTITFNYTGVVIPWYTLPLKTSFFGAPALAINLMNIVAGLSREKKFKAHEWNHVFDKYVLQELYEANLFEDMRQACQLVVKEGPYSPRTLAEMGVRAKEIVERVCTEYGIMPDDPRLGDIGLMDWKKIQDYTLVGPDYPGAPEPEAEDLLPRSPEI